MIFANPTPLRIGMVGTLFGKRYRITGRVVLGTEQAGQTCYWNEFNLLTLEGEEATLVFEETERGGEWRLFILFEPQHPLTAEDAATKRAGNRINLEGTDARITLVAESRIYQIEGQAPEGEEVGDIAHYFNAEAGNTMIVVSWTGNEVECYRGVETLPVDAVRTAFDLHGQMPGEFTADLNSPDADAASASRMKLIGVLLALVIAFVGYWVLRPNRPVATVRKISAPASHLKLGSIVSLNGRDYQVRAHELVEIAQVGLVYERHEYQLFESSANQALLVYGFRPGAKAWHLFLPLQPLTPLTPEHAAALQMGQTVNVDGYAAIVSQLFRSTVRQAESAEGADPEIGTTLYGFGAQSNSILLLVRWNQSGIAFYGGKKLASAQAAGLR